MNKYSEYEKYYARVSLKLRKIDHHVLIAKMNEQKWNTGYSWNHIVLLALYNYYGIDDQFPKARKNVRYKSYC